MESKEKRELCIHLLHSATNYNVKYGRQHKLNYNSMPSAFSLAQKLSLLQRHRNCGSGGYTPSDKVGGSGGGGGGRSSRPRVVSQKIVFRPFGLHFGLKIRRGRPPGPFLWIRHCVVTSHHGHVLSIQFGDNHVVWSEANYYCS